MGSSKFFFVAIIILFGFSLNCEALNIRLYGRSGVELVDDKTRICPGLTLNCCAVVQISWNDVKSFLEGYLTPIHTTVTLESGEVFQNVEMKVVDATIFDIVDESTSEIYLSDDEKLDFTL